MTEVLATVERILNDPATIQNAILQDVPMLASQWGAKDEDALLHTLGVNLFASLGRAAGFVGLAEFPIPRAIQWQRKVVRVDSAWFDRSSRRPVVLVEFERYSMETMLEKVTNLYVAAHGCDATPSVLLLCVWALDGAPVDAKWFDANRGLPVSGGPVAQRPQGASVVLIQAVIGRQADLLHFVRFRRLV